MRDFKRYNKDSRFSGRDSRSSGYGRDRDYERPQLHDAVCDECGKNCKVPFKPTGNKEIFCSDCFERRQGSERSGGYSRNDNYRSDRNDRNDRYDSRDREMFSAICDECGKDCKLPFKPSSDKPVYCSSCFEKRGEAAGLHEHKKEKSFDTKADNQIKNELEHIKGQITSINDKLIMIMNALKIESVTVTVSKDDYTASLLEEPLKTEEKIKTVKKEVKPKKKKVTVKKKAVVKKKATAKKIS